MALAITFAVFISAIIICLVLEIPLVIALLMGLVAFVVTGKTRGFSLQDIFSMAYQGIKSSVTVAEILFMIGLIMAIWRASGTITFFVYYGLHLVTPPLFILLSFLMSCLLSYILGTSFLVAGTLGVIFMTLARSGGIDPLIAAGAIMSGIYYGDRCSPASSSAVLVASITKTKLTSNVAAMHKTGAIAFLVSIVIYTILSIRNPLDNMDITVMESLIAESKLSIISLIPVIFILVLPLLKIDIRWAFISSILSGFIIMISLQQIDFTDAVRYCILGYTTGNEEINEIIGGGGAVSMLNVCGIIMLSGAYSGIFKGTDMLSGIQHIINDMINRKGRYLTMLLTGILTSALFCSQAIAVMFCSDLMTEPYLKTNGSREEIAIDIENSTIVIAALIPWNIACSVPMRMMDVGIGMLKYSYLLFLIPGIHFFTKRIWFKDRG